MMTIAAVPARAETPFPERDAEQSTPIDQVIYRGVVGNILEAVPLPPEQRVQLQRGNAVVSNTLTGRSIAVLLGLASPVFIIGGLIWGIWAAANIKATPTPDVPDLTDAAAVSASDALESAQATSTAEAVQPSSSESDLPDDPARLAKTE
jgi:hypothetical protein